MKFLSFPPNRVGIRNSTDYSPFGVELEGRTVSLEGYRFGYQGSEKDNALLEIVYNQIEQQLMDWCYLIDNN